MVNPPAVVHNFPRLVLKPKRTTDIFRPRCFTCVNAGLNPMGCTHVEPTTVLMDGLLPGTPAVEVPLIYCMDERHDEPCPLPCPACEDEC